MRNLRDLIPTGILPPREEMMKISAAIDMNMQRETQMEHDFSYYRPGEKQPVARKITEENWARTIRLVHGAVSAQYA